MDIVTGPEKVPLREGIGLGHISTRRSGHPSCPWPFSLMTFWDPHPPRGEARETQGGPVGEAGQCPHQELGFRRIDLNPGS